MAPFFVPVIYYFYALVGFFLYLLPLCVRFFRYLLALFIQ
ncbi:hypothetical protein P20439_2370 [Pseudoalteromonas sp. BSi20439]|nr:hypothetical protein P20439_2370 [Pseudoalteromonas sp. BSi20439]